MLQNSYPKKSTIAASAAAAAAATAAAAAATVFEAMAGVGRERLELKQEQVGGSQGQSRGVRQVDQEEYSLHS